MLAYVAEKAGEGRLPSGVTQSPRGLVPPSLRPSLLLSSDSSQAGSPSSHGTGWPPASIGSQSSFLGLL